MTAEEIDARIRAWRDTKIGLLQVLPTIYFDGKPLTSAEIRLVPEKFLGPELQPAVATTNELGEAALKSAGDLPNIGVQLGLYRIEVSKKEGDRESIPARYNAETELGVEISPENAIVERDWKLSLSSRAQ